VMDAWHRIKGYEEEGLHTIASVFDSIRHGVSAIWDDTWNYVSSRASSGVRTAVSWFNSMGSKIAGVLRGLPGELYNLGKNAIMGLIHGIESLAGDVGSAVGRIASSIPGDVMHLLGIRSPSTVMREIGRNIGLGLVVGINSTAAQITAAVRKIVANAKSIAATTVGDYNITGITAASGSKLTAGGIATSLRADLASIRRFNSDIKKLAREGLNRTLLTQIIQAGPVQGGPVAAALAAGPQLDINSLNRTEKGIANASSVLGMTSAIDTAGKVGSGRSITVNIGVAGNPAEVGRLVVRAIEKFEQKSGKGWRK
jgi:hypothetical protein